MDLPRRFYLVKLQEFQNPDLVAAEELLCHQRVILEARRMKSVYKNQLISSLYYSSYYAEDQKRKIENLKLLQVSLDKLTFANKRSLIKAARVDSSPEEIDNIGLRFGMLHGCNNLVGERKILKKTGMSPRNKNPPVTLEDYDCRIRRLHCSFHYGRHESAIEKQRILREIQEHKLAKEEAVQSAVYKGEIWESLGDKDELQKKIKIMQEEIDAYRGENLELNAKVAYAARELEEADKDWARLDKQLSDIDKIMEGPYKCFHQWRNEHLQANAGYNQNVSILNDARKLAKGKDVTSLRSLCEQQMATFMEKWNNDRDFRNDYTRRALISLNARGLCSDGRTRNHDEAPIAIEGQKEKLPRELSKAVRGIKSAVRNPREMEGGQGNRITHL